VYRPSNHANQLLDAIETPSLTLLRNMKLQTTISKLPFHQ